VLPQGIICIVMDLIKDDKVKYLAGYYHLERNLKITQMNNFSHLKTTTAQTCVNITFATAAVPDAIVRITFRAKHIRKEILVRACETQTNETRTSPKTMSNNGGAITLYTGNAPKHTHAARAHTEEYFEHLITKA
jgi:hypothetical protein